MEDPKEKAKYLISKLGVEGAERQALEEMGNSDTCPDRLFWYQVLDEIKDK